MRQHQHAGRKFQLARDGSGKAEQHEWIVERILVRVRPGQLRLAILVRAFDHVIVGHQVGIAHILGGKAEFADRIGISGDLGRRIGNAQLHGPVLSKPESLPRLISGRPYPSKTMWVVRYSLVLYLLEVGRLHRAGIAEDAIPDEPRHLVPQEPLDFHDRSG